MRDRRPSAFPGRRFGRWIVATSLALVVLAPAAAPAAAAETAECANLSPCTSIPNTPWVAVLPARFGYDDENHVVTQASTVLWRGACPVTEVPAGRDYLVPEEGSEPEPLIVNAFVPILHTGITGSYFAFFYAAWAAGESTSFQPLIGCIPKQAAAAASATAKSGTRTVRTITRTLHADQSKTFAHHCAKGERLGGAGHAVGFFKEKPPSKRELRDLDVERTERRGRVIVRVHTGSSVGDHERVELQVHAFCR